MYQFYIFNTISYPIEDRTFKKVLIDLRASVSLMSLSIYPKLVIRKFNDRRMNLKFAYHSIKHAYGIAVDVLIKIEKFSFLVDIVIVDMSEDEEILLI